MKKKKADVQMVSYVILIVIAISLSVAVYAFLKLRVPTDRETCPEDVSVIIDEAVCSGGKLNVSISNRGLFNVSILFIRFAEENRNVRPQINNKSEVLPYPLSPGFTIRYIYNVSSVPGNYAVEVQPGIFTRSKTTALCKNIAVQPVSCT